MIDDGATAAAGEGGSGGGGLAGGATAAAGAAAAAAARLGQLEQWRWRLHSPGGTLEAMGAGASISAGPGGERACLSSSCAALARPAPGSRPYAGAASLPAVPEPPGAVDAPGVLMRAHLQVLQSLACGGRQVGCDKAGGLVAEGPAAVAMWEASLVWAERLQQARATASGGTVDAAALKARFFVLEGTAMPGGLTAPSGAEQVALAHTGLIRGAAERAAASLVAPLEPPKVLAEVVRLFPAGTMKRPHQHGDGVPQVPPGTHAAAVKAAAEALRGGVEEKQRLAALAAAACSAACCCVDAAHSSSGSSSRQQQQQPGQQQQETQPPQQQPQQPSDDGTTATARVAAGLLKHRWPSLACAEKRALQPWQSLTFLWKTFAAAAGASALTLWPGTGQVKTCFRLEGSGGGGFVVTDEAGSGSFTVPVKTTDASLLTRNGCRPMHVGADLILQPAAHLAAMPGATSVLLLKVQDTRLPVDSVEAVTAALAAECAPGSTLAADLRAVFQLAVALPAAEVDALPQVEQRAGAAKHGAARARDLNKAALKDEQRRFVQLLADIRVNRVALSDPTFGSAVMDAWEAIESTLEQKGVSLLDVVRGGGGGEQGDLHGGGGGGGLREVIEQHARAVRAAYDAYRQLVTMYRSVPAFGVTPPAPAHATAGIAAFLTPFAYARLGATTEADAGCTLRAALEKLADSDELPAGGGKLPVPDSAYAHVLRCFVQSPLMKPFLSVLCTVLDYWQRQPQAERRSLHAPLHMLAMSLASALASPAAAQMLAAVDDGLLTAAREVATHCLGGAAAGGDAADDAAAVKVLNVAVVRLGEVLRPMASKRVKAEAAALRRLRRAGVLPGLAPAAVAAASSVGLGVGAPAGSAGVGAGVGSLGGSGGGGVITVVALRSVGPGVGAAAGGAGVAAAAGGRSGVGVAASSALAGGCGGGDGGGGGGGGLVTGAAPPLRNVRHSAIAAAVGFTKLAVDASFVVGSDDDETDVSLSSDDAEQTGVGDYEDDDDGGGGFFGAKRALASHTGGPGAPKRGRVIDGGGDDGGSLGGV